MFDIGFLELLICGVIALLVLGPERLPVAARTAGRWIGSARRLVNQFSSELDRQLKADELREELRKAGGDIGLEDVQKSVRGALEEARKYENMILPEEDTRPPAPAPANQKSLDEAPDGDSAGKTATGDTPHPAPADNTEPPKKPE